MVDIPFQSLFSWTERPTLGHNQKIIYQYSRTDIRKYFFANRVVPVWNNLPVSIVDTDTLTKFKSALNVHDFSHLCRGCAYRA